MKYILALIVLTLSIPAAPAPASTAAGLPRFVIVVENSLAMGRAKKEAARAVEDLLVSGFDGQIHPGDTFALWTFNDSVNTRFKPLAWDLAERQRLADLASKHVRNLHYSAGVRMDKLMPTLLSSLQNSPQLTLLVVTSGENPVYGTPFDLSINLTFSQNRHELRKLHLPFVLSLFGEDHKLIGFGIHSGAPPVRLPRPPSMAAVEPAILSAPDLTPAKTNAPVAAEVKKPTPPPVESSPPPAAAEVTKRTSPPVNSTPPPVVAELTRPTPPPVESTPPPVTAEVTKRTPPPVESSPPPVVAEITRPTSPPPEPAPKPQPTLPISAPPPQIQESPTPSPIPVPSPTTTSPSPTTTSTSAPPPAILATQPVDSSSPSNRWIFLSSSAAAVILLFWWWTRSRRPAQASLISQSIDSTPHSPPTRPLSPPASSPPAKPKP